MAKARRMLILIHTPHDTLQVSKRKGVERTLAILKELNYDFSRIIVDHNTENTMDLTRTLPVWAGLTVYPYSKLNPERVCDILKKWGIEQILVNSSADWGVSDPISLPKAAKFMAERQFTESQIAKVMFDNPKAFYSQTEKFKPQTDLPYIDPCAYQLLTHPKPLPPPLPACSRHFNGLNYYVFMPKEDGNKCCSAKAAGSVQTSSIRVCFLPSCIGCFFLWPTPRLRINCGGWAVMA